MLRTSHSFLGNVRVDAGLGNGQGARHQAYVRQSSLHDHSRYLGLSFGMYCFLQPVQEYLVPALLYNGKVLVQFQCERVMRSQADQFVFTLDRS